MVALAVQPRALGAEVRVCAPPDEEFTELPVDIGLQRALFARVPDAVHHGCAGTTTTAARAAGGG